MSKTFDPVWEKRYAENPGYRSWYPYTEVVSFVFHYAPRDRSRGDVSVLEIGCGTGNNLWFVAREGYRAAGIDGSATAIEFAQERLSREGLSADLRVGDFAKLPFDDGTFDLVFDRGALSLANAEGATSCVREVRRVIKPGGWFQCGPFSDRDSSFYRTPDPDGAVRDIKVGMIVGGQSRFYSIQDMRDLLAAGWSIERLQHIEEAEMLEPGRIVHGRWLAIARAK